MESERKFETTLLDEETLQENQERRKKKPIDMLDIDNLELLLRIWERKGESENSDKAEHYTKEIIADNYDTFLRADEEVSIEGSLSFWRQICTSSHPFFDVMRTDVWKSCDTDLERFSEIQKRVRESLTDRSLPIEAWVSVLKEYKVLMLDYEKNLQTFTPEIRRGIKLLFIANINPDLETPKTEEEIGEVLEKVELRIRDPLSSWRNIGEHNGSERTIDLDLSVLLKDGEGGLSKDAVRLIAHEELHALSAGQVVKHRLVHETNGIGFVSTKPQWSGLQVSGFMIKRFTWLNEAMTETLSAQLAKTEAVSYPEYREFLDLLLVKGKKKIDRKLLTNAYFEKRGYQADEDNGHKFWNQFRQEIREAYDHDSEFLVKIDILIQNKGIREALKLLKEWDPENPQTLDIKTIENKTSDDIIPA